MCVSVPDPVPSPAHSSDTPPELVPPELPPKGLRRRPTPSKVDRQSCTFVGFFNCLPSASPSRSHSSLEVLPHLSLQAQQSPECVSPVAKVSPVSVK